MGWAWIVAAAWIALAFGVALLVGRSIAHADQQVSDPDVDAPNFIVERPPLDVPPKPVDSDGTESRVGRTAPAGNQPTTPSAPERDTPTIPGLPAARPPVRHPPGLPSTRKRPTRRSGLG
jgi:hypothetical protein